MKEAHIVSYGAGINSTAMVLLMIEDGIAIDAILFADTGGEKPETYAFIKEFNSYLVSQGQCGITVVKNDFPQGIIDGSLENECLRTKSLPSKAYGWGSCSMKWKRDPQERWIKRTFFVQRDGLDRLFRYVGMGAEEQHRADKFSSDGFICFKFPLIEHKYYREDCVALITNKGLSVPPKSACFFCPMSKKKEILALSKKHPDLFARAVQIEKTALASTLRQKGLGRSFSWAELVTADDAQQKLFCDAPDEMPCACFDGEEE